MTLEYHLTVSDLRAGLAIHRPGRIASRTVGATACVGLIGIGIALSILAPTITPASVAADLRQWSAVSLWLGATLLMLQAAQEFMVQRMLQRHAAAQDATRTVVTEAGFEAETRGAQSHVEWQRFCGFRESSGHFLLYLTPDRYSLFPKRAFGSEADVGAFRDMALRLVVRKV